MTTLDWLQNRPQNAVFAPSARGSTPTIPNDDKGFVEVTPTIPNKSPREVEVTLINPNKSPSDPRVTPSILNKSPRIPEEPYITFGEKNIFSEGKENIVGAGEEVGGLGASRGFIGVFDVAPVSVGAADPPARPGMKKPFFTADGTLSIPFDSDPRYHWWKGGQSVKATVAELERERNRGQPDAGGDNS